MTAIELGGEQVEVKSTRHAVERWRERIMPTASEVLARSQLFAFMAGAHFVTRVPRWLHGERVGVDAGYRLALNPTRSHTALVVAEDGTIVSVLTAERRPRLLKRPNHHHDLDRRRK